ncbi:MAG: serine hydrolase [Flavobacteriales bacterium]|nr:serine hydrolase [Flavobacteriales bacterium]
MDNKKLGGINCCIWKDRKLIFQRKLWLQEFGHERAIDQRCHFRISSMTKPITSVIAMMLYEESKKLKLSDPITKWFPQFANMRKSSQIS